VSRGNESNYTIFINILLNKMRFKPPRDERRVLAQSQKVTVWAATPHCANAVYRRHPVITPDERLRFSIVPWRFGISLGKNRFCSVRHNALFFREQNHRGTHQCSRWVPLFFIRHSYRSVLTGASGASQTTPCKSVAMLDQGQKTVMRKRVGNHWLRTLGNLYIIIFQWAHSNEQR